MTRAVFKVALGAVLLLVATALHAQDATPPITQPDLEVKEWLVILSSPNQPHANAASAVVGSLPDALDPLRLAPEGEKVIEPAPIGVIRFSGHSDNPFTLRLTTPDDGLCYTTWPTANVRSPNLSWPDLTVSTKPGRVLAPGDLNWLAPLRDSPGPFVTSAGRSEKFLLYDAEFPFFLPLVLEGQTSIRVKNRGDGVLHDIVLYRPGQDGKAWSTAKVADLSPKPDSGPAATRPALSDEAQFEPVEGDIVASVASQWKSILADWQLEPSDFNLIVSILKKYALDEGQTTAVFRLDEAQLAHLLPMQVVPKPARVRRLALVIARNVDPNLDRVVDSLIAQMGDRDWRKREAATKALSRIGPSANNRLREALQSTDAEIVLRAERLLAHNAMR